MLLGCSHWARISSPAAAAACQAISKNFAGSWLTGSLSQSMERYVNCWRVKIRAPAKINLSLRVVGRRADGYHLLDTVMVPVSLYDELDLRVVRRTARGKLADALIQIHCDHPAVPQDETNLVYRAADLIMKKGRKSEPVRIRLKKNIPVGAGLGGGSS